ncbi:MAG: response regulator transcription factor [Herbaspirillum sp.]|jgi:DNA-binding NarL/FixJ family response regulator|nr:response regulator transcription factor [Herbaspirillum sp.]
MFNPSLVRILLVDDHPLVRDGLRARLETVPHFAVVGEADRAEQALQHAAALDIDLVLMDINLSGTNGIELTGSFHSLYPEVAVLILSMHDKAEYVRQAVQAGARGYVLKDAPATDIIDAIDTVMSGGMYYSAGLSTGLAPAALLTPRETDILKRIATGKSNKHIARDLGLSFRTVETHRLNIKRKLGIEGQADLIRFALEQTMV